MQLPNDIAIRFASRPTGDGLVLEKLSNEERAQVDSFGSEKRKREFALGRTAARDLLAERLAVAGPAVPLRVAADGAPEVEGYDLHLSLSHVATDVRTLAAVVAAPYPVGIDLELIQPRRPDLYRFLLAPEDYGLLDALPHTHDEAQVLIWTLKEAVLKAMRTGFRLSPKKLRLTVEAKEMRAQVTLDDSEPWTLKYERREGCFLAVAFQM